MLPSRSLTLGCAALLVASCQPPSLTGAPDADRIVSANAWGNVVLTVDGRTFHVRTADGKPIGSMSVQVGRHRYPIEDGSLALPAAALQQAKTDQRGFFLILAQGYTAEQVWIGQPGDEIRLSPATPITLHPSVGVAGATLRSPDAGIAVTIPPGAIAEDGTPVALSEYVPPLDDEDAARMVQERQSAIAKLQALTPAPGSGIIASGGGNYRVTASEDCALPGVLPCDPYTGLGLLVTVQGPLEGGTLEVELDLAALLKGVPAARYSVNNLLPIAPTLDTVNALAQGVFEIPPGLLKQPPSKIAAWRLRKTLQQLDKTYGKAWVDALFSDSSVTFDGEVIRFPVDLSAATAGDDQVKVHVSALDTLMTRVEVTVTSAAGQALRPEASLPDLIALSPARFVPADTSLISSNTADLISDKGLGVVSGSGGSLIANNGGSLSGQVRTPFFANQAKFNLLGLVEYNWPGDGRVRAVTETGAALSDWVALDGEGRYVIPDVQGVAGVTFVEAEAGSQRLRTVASQPATDVAGTADISTSTTCVASTVRYAVGAGRFGVEDINLGDGFRQDLGAITEQLNEDRARTVMQAGIPVIAELTTSLIGEPASVAAPMLKGVRVKLEQVPAGAAAAIAYMTGLPEGEIREGAVLQATQQASLSGGTLAIALRALDDVPPGGGSVRLRYAVEVERGSGETATYDFVFLVSDLRLLAMTGRPLPLSVGLHEPRRVGGSLLGNFWRYGGTNTGEI